MGVGGGKGGTGMGGVKLCGGRLFSPWNMAQTATKLWLLLDLPNIRSSGWALINTQILQQDCYSVFLLLNIDQTLLEKKIQISLDVNYPHCPWLPFTCATSLQTSSGSCLMVLVCWDRGPAPSIRDRGKSSKGWFLGLSPRHSSTGDR